MLNLFILKLAHVRVCLSILRPISVSTQAYTRSVDPMWFLLQDMIVKTVMS